MSKVVKALLLCAYIALITQYIKSLIMSKTHEELLEIEYVMKPKALSKKTERELKKNKKRNVTIHYKVPQRLPTDLKYILKYTEAFAHKSTSILPGQEEFIKAKCEYINCYITNDRRLLFDIYFYDAILFDVENTWDGYPPIRSPHQKYIFVASESAQDNPICNKIFDNFFNITWTYKLDSDVQWSYFTIYDKNRTVVGPKINMTWLQPMDPTPEVVKKKLEKKDKAAAWFVSNCNTKSKRRVMYDHLELEFMKYNMTIDIFGWCGKKACSKDRMADCLEVIEKEYYFYLAFENSLCEDYVTEKLMHALSHYAVPIVYGGANYSRFLPPGSYINAYDESPENVASLVSEAMQNPKIYEDYFRWHNHYVYQLTDDIGDVCTLCELMNRPTANKTAQGFRRWWNPDYIHFTADCKY